MNAIVMNKAIDALIGIYRARPSSEGQREKEYFGQVWVVGNEIYFTLNAARRSEDEQNRLHPYDPVRIEKITAEDAFKMRGRNWEREKQYVSEDPMEGETYGEFLFIN